MANFINIYSSIAEYNADESKEYPNVSYLEVEDEVKWQATEPIDQEHVVAKYNVTDTSNPTTILNGAGNITAMIVDGVQQPSVSTSFTFSTTGEHKVKYKINSSWNGYRAFFNCSSLTSITIPDSVTSIGEWAFRNCSGLTSVIIGNGVTSIGREAFYGCSGLTSVTIPDSVVSISGSAFSNCTGLTTITIGSGVTSIGDSAFIDCRSLTNVTIPDSVTNIGQYAFENCYNLASITIGDGVTRIGVAAFQDCRSLTSVTIPDGVTSIEKATFYGCSGLTSITVKATTPPTLSNTNAFSNTNNCPIYVPSASVDTYKTASGWSTYASRIQAIQ